jgi:hypothetical protein
LGFNHANRIKKGQKEKNKKNVVSISEKILPTPDTTVLRLHIKQMNLIQESNSAQERNILTR